MEIKKTSKANLEKDISLNYLMGLVIALAILFVGFQWGEKEIEVTLDSGIAAIIEEEDIEATQQDDPPPPAPEPEKIVAPDIIDIVDDNIEVDTFDFDTEDDAGTAQVAVYVAPVEVVADDEPEDFIFMTVEKQPEFPGGELALFKWLNDNLVYPPIAAESGIAGRVMCQFVVNADGSVVDVEIVRGRDPYLDKEALRVLNKLPKFKPGEQRGKPVRVRFSLPVTFKLQQ